MDSMPNLTDDLICSYDNCGKYFERPILIPCNELICECHINQENGESFLCKLCGEMHKIPSDGFKLNKVMTKLIDLNFHLKQNSKHFEVKRKFEQIQNYMDDYDKFGLIDPDNYIFEQFSHLKNKIDLRRELLIKAINETHENMIKNVEICEKECKSNVKNVAKIDLEHLKNELIPTWNLNIRTPHLTEEFLDSMSNEISGSMNQINSCIVKYKLDIMMNRIYKFEFNMIKNEDIFGNLIIKDTLEEDEKFGLCISTLKGHSKQINSIKILNNPTRIVSCSSDNSIRIWSLDDEKCLKTLTGHTNLIFSIMPLANNNELISASTDNTIKLWNLNTGDCLKTVQFNTSPICLSEMDIQHFLCGFNNGTIELFDINEFESINSINAFPHRVMNIKPLLNSTFLACSIDPTIKMIDNFKISKVYAGHKDCVHNIELSRDLQTMYSSSHDGSVKIWNVNEATCLFTILIESQKKVHCTKLIRDNLLVIAIGENYENLRLFNLNTKKWIKSFYGHNCHVKCIDFIKDDHIMVSCSTDKTIRLWRV